MAHNSQHVQTLYDYASERQWIRMLGWSDDELRSVPVYEQATAGEEMINLSNFGETALGTSANAGGPTSADARSIPNLWAYRSSTPPDLWLRLKDLERQGGPEASSASGPLRGTESSGPSSSGPGR